MRYSDIIREDDEIVPSIDQKKLKKAESDGFDTSKLWYHGTKKNFANFRLPTKNGINELGKGIYVTRFVGTANVWAQGAGTVLTCVLKQGKLIEMTKLPLSQIWDSGPEAANQYANPYWREIFRGYNAYLERVFGPNSALDYRNFAERFNRETIELSLCLAELGYIGATNLHSQIKGQAVIWDPKNIRVVGKAAGYDGYVHSTQFDQRDEADL